MYLATPVVLALPASEFDALFREMVKERERRSRESDEAEAELPHKRTQSTSKLFISIHFYGHAYILL
jgi:hypothetical protein